MQILIWVMMIVGGAAGLLSTAYLVLAMPIITGHAKYSGGRFVPDGCGYR